MRVFHTSFNRWFFPLKCEWYQISSDLPDSSKYYDRSSDLYSAVACIVSIPPLIHTVSFPNTWRYFQALQVQLISSSLSCSTSFSALWQHPSIFLSFCFLLFSLNGLMELQQKKLLYDHEIINLWNSFFYSKGCSSPFPFSLNSNLMTSKFHLYTSIYDSKWYRSVLLLLLSSLLLMFFTEPIASVRALMDTRILNGDFQSKVEKSLPLWKIDVV